MALQVGVNSWVSVAEADTYFETRIDADKWAALQTEEKESYLVTAYYWLITDPAVEQGPSTTAPEYVKYGQCEAALLLLNGGSSEIEFREILYSAGVREFTKSKWKEKLSEQQMPQRVINFFILAGVYNGGHAGSAMCVDSNDCY